MKNLVLILSAALLTTAHPAFASTYSCRIDAPVSVVEDGKTARLMPIGLPKEFTDNPSFVVSLTPQKDSAAQNAQISWKGDPMNLAGEFAALPTGEGAISIVTFSGGPCLFTETACTTNIQIVDQPDGSANLLILPSALATDRPHNARKPFVVIIHGNCVKGGKR